MTTNPHAEVFERVRRCIGECLAIDPATIDGQASLVDDLGADSLDFIDILFALEKAFGVKLRSAQVEAFLRADFSEGNLIEGRYVEPAAVQQLAQWLPALARAATPERITPAQVFAFVTVETFVLIVAEAQGR